MTDDRSGDDDFTDRFTDRDDAPPRTGRSRGLPGYARLLFGAGLGSVFLCCGGWARRLESGWS